MAVPIGQDVISLGLTARESATAVEHLLQVEVLAFGRKYQPAGYQRMHILKSLVFFEDAEKDPMPDLLVTLDWNDVKQFFLRETPRGL